MNTRQAPRSLNLTLNENKYKSSMFYTSDEDRVLKKIKAEQDLNEYRNSQKKQYFNISRKQSKEQKKIIKQQQKIIKKQQKQKQQQQKILTNNEKMQILENMRNNIRDSNEIKDFYEVDVNYFPLKKMEDKRTIAEIEAYKESEKELKQIWGENYLKIAFPDVDSDEKDINKAIDGAEELILSLFYNIYKKYKNTDVMFIYINKNKDRKKNRKLEIETNEKNLKEDEEELKNIPKFIKDNQLRKKMIDINETEKRVEFIRNNYDNKKKYNAKIRDINSIKNNIESLKNDILFSNVQYISKEQSFAKWWKIFSTFGANIFFSLSETGGYEDYFEVNDEIVDNIKSLEGKIIVYPVKKNRIENFKFIKQNFKEHTFSNCLLEPIKEWAIMCKNTAQSKTSFFRYRKIEDMINTYIDKYLENGVPQDDINDICNKLQIDIDISLPLQKNKILECKSTKKALKTFSFINTKFNHIEYNKLVLENNYITTYINNDGKRENLTSDELQNIKDKLDDKNEFYMYNKNKDKISSIITLNGQYTCQNEYSIIVKGFEKETCLEYCKICDINDYDISTFVRNGCHYNTSLNFIDSLSENKTIKDICHIDMEKAYANFKSCNYYNGFLGKITDFRKTNKIMGIGMYQINNINFSNVEENIKQLLLKLNIYHDNYIYPSPELKFLEDNNITFDIISGAWGHSPFEFDFNACAQLMLNKKDNNVPYYAKWCGGANSYNISKNYILKSSKEYDNILKYNCNEYDNITYISQTEESIITINKKYNYHLSHITSFILSYQRLNLIEQLKEINYNDIIRINVDCIYYYKSNKEITLKNVFRHKEFKELILHRCGHSLIPLIDYVKPYNYSNIEVDDNYKSKINLGCGGSGKTTKELRDTGLIKKIFCPPSWKLARNKEKEENINVSVWYYITTKDEEVLNKILKKYNVLIIDEVSMMTDETKNFLLDKFKLCKIIFCGDLGYQLPPIKGEEMTINSIEKIEYFNNNYRCKCPLLLELLNNCRKMIKDENIFIYNINEYIINYFKKNNRIINKKKLIEIYDINDMILSSTNLIKNNYTELFKGKFETKKIYITSNSRQYSNGEIIITNEDIKGVSKEERYCYTTHSIQGETAYDKLFIDINNIFDERMFYTALSRAMYLDQIYLISN